MSKVHWLTKEDFFTKENEYRNGLMDEAVFMKICEKYNVIGVNYGFVQPHNMKHKPNLRDILEKAEKYSERYLDHLYSFIDKDGKIFWVSCPYHFGRDRYEIKGIFDKAKIPCEVYDAFYANCTIVIPAEATMDLVYNYIVLPKGKRFECVKMLSDRFTVVERLAIYDDEKSANGFLDGFMYAINK